MTRRNFWILLAMIIGSGIVILDGSVVNLALPNMQRHLGASFADLQWIVDGYLLSLSALILLGGSLGDIFGRKRVYMLGLLGFGLSSLLCGLSPNVQFLIGARVLQGCFGALLVPGALAIINTSFEPAARPTAIGRWAAWSGIASAIGPLLGGYIIDVASWRWIFFINIPLVIACAVVASRSIIEHREKRTRRVDIGGAVFAAIALAGLCYGLIEGPSHGWSTSYIAALVVGAISFAAFLRTEIRQRDPMLPLRLFRSRNFSGSNIATFAMYGAMGGFFFALVIYLQTHLNYSSLQAGASLLPITILMMTLSGRMGALAGRHGSRTFMTVGPLVMGVGVASLIPLHAGQSYALHVFPGVLLLGLGLSTAVAPLTNAVMSSVSEHESGIASGVNNAVSRVASLVIVAMLGLLGAVNAYKFSSTLCAALLICAGILSFILIRNKTITE